MNDVVDAVAVVPIHIENFCVPVRQHIYHQSQCADNCCCCRIDSNFCDAADDDDDDGYAFDDGSMRARLFH